MAERPLWTPSPERMEEANLTRVARQAIRDWKLGLNDYPGFYRWTGEHPEQLWDSLWKFASVRASAKGARVLVNGDRMPGARWYPEARLNFAENLLRRRDASTAMVFWGEDKIRRRVTHRELYDQVSGVVQGMRALGVKPGDRVAAYLPNLPEAIAAMLAATSIGASFSTCSPDFGVQGVLDRFGQIAPAVLFAADGYFYNGKEIDSLGKVREIAARLPSLKRVVVVPYVSDQPDVSAIPGEQRLHCDVKPGDRLFYFTTLGWMMWNWLASALASGATLLLYDGSPFVRNGSILFDYADAEEMTHLGTSAKFIDAISKAGMEPAKTHRLEHLRTVLSTGSPLAPEGFDYVYRAIKRDVCLSSISGGTDICGCFVLGNPILPVWRGEIQCLALGLRVEVFDENARSVKEQKGELVCTRPFPSLPVGFWNDPDGTKYRAAYFERFPGVWTHGDWCEITAHEGMIIYGRSDAVLNPGGVRIGTAEIYRQVEQLEEVVESLVIGQTWPPGEIGDVRVVLFVKLREGLVLEDGLVAKIKNQIRTHTTPRHVPAKVVQVPDIPRTKSNKIVELAVRDVVHGQPVKNIEALANPEALAHFRNRPELGEP